MNPETIIALSTPPIRSALALVRLSGPLSHSVIQHLSQKESLSPQKSHYLFLYDSENQLIDDVIATLYQSPHSYTGEDMAEISCHGNMLIVEKIIQSAFSLGVRPAHPGEFTQRAFLNGKMDLTQAEAVSDLILAESKRALRAARTIRQGKLSEILTRHRKALIDILAHLEAYIDFPEEDIRPDVGKNFSESIQKLREELSQLIASAEEGRKLREGMRVAIVGKPNVGKSTLLNVLLGQERSIVTNLPGTTRDTVEESLILEGIPVRFIDTAGMRSSTDPIEKLGIQRTEQAIENADLVLHLIDGTVEEEMESDDILSGKNVVCCITKTDLPLRTKHSGLHLSALKGQGIDSLKKEMIQRLNLAEPQESQERIIVNSRHEAHLQQALEAFQRALPQVEAIVQQAQDSEAAVTLSSDLRQVLSAISDIAGETSNEDILDQLFSSFCIGK